MRVCLVKGQLVSLLHKDALPGNKNWSCRFSAHSNKTGELKTSSKKWSQISPNNVSFHVEGKNKKEHKRWSILWVSWLYLAVPSCTWLYLTIQDLAVPDYTWLNLTVSGCTWLPLTVHGWVWMYLSVTECTWDGGGSYLQGWMWSQTAPSSRTPLVWCLLINWIWKDLGAIVWHLWVRVSRFWGRT